MQCGSRVEVGMVGGELNRPVRYVPVVRDSVFVSFGYRTWSACMGMRDRSLSIRIFKLLKLKAVRRSHPSPFDRTIGVGGIRGVFKRISC